MNFHVREGGKGDLSSKKVPAPNDLTEQSKITEVYVSLHEGNKSDFFSIEEVNRYNSLSEYKEGKEFFQGKLKSVPYPDSLKEVFDGALDSQCIQELNRSPSKDKYGNLFKSIGEATLSFEPLIKKEAGFQAVLHGVFSYYSDLKLKDYPRRLVLTEFQTGNAKSIDMLVQSIRLDESEGYDAKRCMPVGLELKGPRTDASTSSLKEEANKQINTNYIKGSNYKVLTDGSKAALIGVVFNRQKNNKKSLIELSKDKFDFAEVGHSSEEEDEDYEMLERCKKRVKNKSRSKNDEVFKLAYCIKDIMELCNRSQDNNLSEAVKKEMVEMCSEESKSHLEKIKSELQKSVKNVVFASEVCITSVYGNEYLYAATDGFKYDESRRRVFTWVPSKRNNPPGLCAGDKQAMWKIQPYGDNFCITSVYNEYLYAAADDLKYNENRRRMFTWVPSKRNNPPGSCGNDKQGMWKIQPYGDNLCITSVYSNEYLYAAADRLNYDKERRRVFTWIPSKKNNPPGSCAGDKQAMWKVEDFGSINSRSDKQGLSNKINLDSNSLKTRRVSDKLNDTYVLASSGRLENDPLLDSYNQTGVRDVISQMTNPKNNEEREKFVLRKRLAAGLSSQSEVTVNSTSTTTRSSSWINSLFGRVKGSVGGLFWFLPLQSEKMSKQSLHKESVPISAVKPKVTTLEMGDIYLSKVDTNSTILLLDTFIRKVTGQRYVSNNTSSISEQKAQGYTLGITDGLKKVIEQAASKSGILMHRLNIDFSGMQKEITRKVMSGKFNEISGVLNSYVEKSCPSKESGKLSPKKFNKFMIEFNKGLDLIINQSMQQISHDGDDVLEVNGAKKQQMSLEPQNYLSNISVQGHLTQDKVKLIS